MSQKLIRSEALVNRYRVKNEKYEKQMEHQKEKLMDYEQNICVLLNAQIADLENK